MLGALHHLARGAQHELVDDELRARSRGFRDAAEDRRRLGVGPVHEDAADDEEEELEPCFVRKIT